MKKMALLLAALLLLSSLTGCGKSSKGEASVESVSMICGLSGVGQVDRFAGVVSAQGETKIAKDENRQVTSVAVKAGDEVKKGQTLFTYDQTQAQLDLEKAQLELDQMKSTLSAKQEEKARLERDKSNVSPDQQLQYDLEIREATAAILEQQYNISLKEKEVQRLTDSVGKGEITSPVDGRVQTVNENGGTDSNAAWETKTIRQFRIYPFGKTVPAADAECYIQYIAFFKTEADAKAFTGNAKTETKNPGTAAQTADPIALVALAAAASAGLAFAVSKKH